MRTRARELAAGGTPCRCQRLVGPDVVQTRIYSESHTPHTHKHTNARARAHTRNHARMHTHTHTHSLLPPLCAYVLARARARVGALQAQGRQAAPYRRACARTRPSRPPTQSSHSHLPTTLCARRTAPALTSCPAHSCPVPAPHSFFNQTGATRSCTCPASLTDFGTLTYQFYKFWYKYQGRISR